jgi:Transposase, Mutator family
VSSSDEAQHIQPPQPHRVDGEEVAGDDSGSLLAQERPPSATRPPWRRVEPVRAERGVDRGGRDALAKPQELVGVRADGTKELVAVYDGERESADAWAELLRDLRRRGMRAPVVMVGDGALGLWRALSEVFPSTQEQRCWVHKVANVLNALPKSVQAGTIKITIMAGPLG